MNRLVSRHITSFAILILLAACASTPDVDPRVVSLQNNLDRLVANTELAARGGEELKNAEIAVRRVVNAPRRMDEREFDYMLYAADRLIQTAEYSARARLADDQRNALVREQEQLVLEARTLEANRAKASAEAANRSATEAMALREQALREAAEAQKMRDMALAESQDALTRQQLAEQAAEAAQDEAQSARLQAMAEAERAEAEARRAMTEAERAAAARAEAEAARAETAELRNMLSELQARPTDRGLLITLGDVLFEFNKSELKPGAARNLQALVKALKAREDQTVIIEGHTDSVGSKAYNMTLSEARARSVRDYLVEQGIASDRMSIEGLGPDFPVADNGTDAGRQQNRRVEVILPQDD